MNSHQHCALNQNDVIVCYFVAEKMYDVDVDVFFPSNTKSVSLQNVYAALFHAFHE